MDEQQKPVVSPIMLFYSYAHEDELLRGELEKHLSLLHRQGLISEWHDRQILAGDEWAADIDQHLETASIVLLLISSDFLASHYCYDIEMKRALERHQRGEVRVIPIILRPCDWRTSPFARLQCLPRDGKAITTWQNPDEAFLAIADGLRRVIERQQIPVRPLPEVERKNRATLIKRVRVTWVEGLLEHSFHEAVRLELHLQERPDVLVNPWRLQVQELDRPPQPLPTGTSIVQMYDEADGELLILGKPGAGKTTLLLELTRTLLDRAEADEHLHIPVVFNLSSWAEKRLPLSKWFVEELWTKYQIPRKVAQGWVAADQILPLLDGLDEVAKEVRPGCVQAINTYYQECVEQREQGLAQLVVCCRIKEYMALSTRVTLRQAVNVQPLTDDQIECYLQSTKGQLEGLQHVLRQDPELYELSRRPLMLSIFTLIYQGVVPKTLPIKGTHEVQQQEVFANYVERMLTRRGASRRASRESVLRWLTFLATRMQHHQTVFYLEQLQPDWLPKQRRAMYKWSVGLFGLFIGLFIGPLIGLAFGLVFGLVPGLLFGLGTGLLFGLAFGLKTTIEPAEVLTLSRKDLRFGLVSVLFIGLAFGLLVVLGLVIVLSVRLVSLLVSGLFIVPLIVLIFGFSGKQLPERQRLSPNEGIRHSIKNGLLMLVARLFVFGLGVGLSVGLVFGLRMGLSVGLSAGLGFGLRAGLRGGLGAALQHYILRFWLWRTDSLPWNLVDFLDEAAERLLLHKIGGGYIFIHRLLLDYFASLETPSSEEAFAASALLQKLDNYSAGASRRPARLPGRGVPGRIPASRRRKQRRRKET